MDKFLHSRFFRFLVCIVLVCAILINCSPIKAQATEIGIGVTGIGVLFWFMLMFGGMAIEPTQDVLNDLDRAGQAYIDDWIVQAADDAAAASEALRKAEADLSEWISDPSNFTGDSSGESGGDDSGDPDWGIHWDENGNIVLGSMLGGALARWFADSILADGVEVKEEVTADEGFAFYENNLLPEIPVVDGYDYSALVQIDADSAFWLFIFRGSEISSLNERYSGSKCEIGVGGSGMAYEAYKLVDGSWDFFHSKSSLSYIQFYSPELKGMDAYYCHLVWSNLNSYDRDGNLTYVSSDPSSTTTTADIVTPSTYVGEIPSQVKAGTYNPDRISFPAFDFSRVISNQESALQEMRNLYEQIRDNQMSYEDYVQQIKPLPSPGVDNPDPSPSEPGETTPDETEPDEGGDDEEITDILPYGLDLTDYFPFCIPFDLYDFFTCLDAAPQAPKFHWEIQDLSGRSYSIDIDLSPWDDLAAFFRHLQLLLFIVGLAAATRKYIKW